MAADILLVDERRWQWLNANGTASFFDGSTLRMLSLSRLELDELNAPCCHSSVIYPCLDMHVFKSPLHEGVWMDLFDFQQNVWQAENYAVGLLRLGGYELYNPCFDLPLFHNHVSGQCPNQNENMCLRVHFGCLNVLFPSHSSPLPPPPHRSVHELRKHGSICSNCRPQQDPSVQCEEQRKGIVWHPLACFVNNSNLAEDRG